MIEISISRELATAHPGFIAGCAERGHRVEVFGDATEPSERRGSEGMTEEIGEAAGQADRRHEPAGRSVTSGAM